ncbi:MAG: hypothetical protein M3P34_01045 [Actinomycetota bacterium]|nr:hypothetical protein [Actinomycetota bacterium]
MLIGGKPAARLGDMCAHGNPLAPGPGCPTVSLGRDIEERHVDPPQEDPEERQRQRLPSEVEAAVPPETMVAMATYRGRAIRSPSSARPRPAPIRPRGSSTPNKAHSR